MHLALDVHYGDTWVRGACVGFEVVEASQPAFVIVETFEGSANAYESGEFKTRELPYLERLIEAARKRCPEVDTVLIDGYVWLGPQRPGLGAYLYQALGSRIAVVGVGKTRFLGAPAIEVLRGRSRSPLYITAAGLEPSEGARLVAAMHGEHRVPTLLRWVDRACRADPRYGAM